MSDPDLLAALRPVLQALSGLGVRHFVGGSIASSAHGVARASVDGDVVAELGPAHVAPFVAALRDTYYVPEERIRDAVARRASFNVIHLDTLLKVDVFVSRDRPFDRRAFERSRPASIGGPGGATLPVSSAAGHRPGQARVVPAGVAKCPSGSGPTSWAFSGPPEAVSTSRTCMEVLWSSE